MRQGGTMTLQGETKLCARSQGSGDRKGTGGTDFVFEKGKGGGEGKEGGERAKEKKKGGKKYTLEWTTLRYEFTLRG